MFITYISEMLLPLYLLNYFFLTPKDHPLTIYKWEQNRMPLMGVQLGYYYHRTNIKGSTTF